METLMWLVAFIVLAVISVAICYRTILTVFEYFPSLANRRDAWFVRAAFRATSSSRRIKMAVRLNNILRTDHQLASTLAWEALTRGYLPTQRIAAELLPNLAAQHPDVVWDKLLPEASVIPDAIVQLYVVRSLRFFAKMDFEQLSFYLMRALSDQDTSVRDAALTALAVVGRENPKCFEQLKSCLISRNRRRWG